MSVLDQFRFSFVFLGLPKMGPNRYRPIFKTPSGSISAFLATMLPHRLIRRSSDDRPLHFITVIVKLCLQYDSVARFYLRQPIGPTS